jgi:CheY-like chemotaxis protein
LSTVHNIVQQSGGEIEVHSEPGRGATFTIWLPRAEQSAGAVRDATPAPAQAGYETVLLVEDEDGVRRLLTQLLRRSGYQVLEASGGAEALRIFETRVRDIHLVLTDIVMPGMSGRMLASRLRELRPEIRIIFMSGYPNDVLTRTGALTSGMSFLQKPLRPEVLAARVREALDSPTLPFNPR